MDGAERRESLWAVVDTKLELLIMGFIEFLFCVFMVLKLCGVVAWSWWWVASPFWIGYPIIIVIFCFALRFIKRCQ